MGKKTRYRIKAFTNMRNPFAIVEAGGQRGIFINGYNSGAFTMREALKGIKRMKQIYPHSFRYRIERRRT